MPEKAAKKTPVVRAIQDPEAVTNCCLRPECGAVLRAHPAAAWYLTQRNARLGETANCPQCHKPQQRFLSFATEAEAASAIGRVGISALNPTRGLPSPYCWIMTARKKGRAPRRAF